MIRDRWAAARAYDASCLRFQAEIDAAAKDGDYEAVRVLRNAAIKAGRTFLFGRAGA